MKVIILMGSLSDKEKMSGASKALEEFGISYSARVLSAHRVPEALKQYLQEQTADNNSDPAEVVIAGAGMAAHLPGVIASLVTIPVIGVPLDAKLDGMDALLSIVQMPKGIPVATVAINNSYNAGLLAVQILAVKYPDVKEKLLEYRKKMKDNFLSDHNTEITF